MRPDHLPDNGPENGTLETNLPSGTVKSHRHTRTWLLRLLVLGYLVVAWFGWVRLYAMIANGNVLGQYLSQGMQVYIAVSGAVLGLAGLIAALAVWFGMPFASRVSRSAALGCFIWFWFDYLFLTQSPLSRTNLPFALTFTLFALIFAWVVPVLPGEKSFLQKRKL